MAHSAGRPPWLPGCGWQSRALHALCVPSSRGALLGLPPPHFTRTSVTLGRCLQCWHFSLVVSLKTWSPVWREHDPAPRGTHKGKQAEPCTPSPGVRAEGQGYAGAPAAPPQAAATAGPGPAGTLGAGRRQDVHTASQPATAGIRGRSGLRAEDGAAGQWGGCGVSPAPRRESPLWSRVRGEPAVLGLASLRPSRHFSALPLPASHTGQEGAGAVRPRARSHPSVRGRRLPARGTGHPGPRAHPAPREPGRTCGSGPPSLGGPRGARGSSSTAGEVSPARLLEKVWTELRGQGQPSPAPPTRRL